ncbi:protein BZR1 homolog 2-like [Malania oleifera]|uniref:protein BZR1 homolog 2-like n=1 Tax=Malania oleifera TaxID=397392 RepID=UPI0025AE5A10|nr:protein BZR1 homolog 2-like [Malania oleifera]
MKEAVPAATGVGMGGKSESEKEKTKLRERQRRSVTAKILHGLRKHGGYRLSPRADINEVLRHLAREAGWIVLPDGTTYRSQVSGHCPLCGAATPTSSIVGGGDCSTAASPRYLPVGESPEGVYFPADAYSGGRGYSGGSGSGGAPSSSQGLIYDRENPFALYMCGLAGSGSRSSASVAAVDRGSSELTVAYQQQQAWLQEARASNHCTPVAVGSPSPQRRA